MSEKNSSNKGPMAAMMAGGKAKDFKGTMKKLIKYISEYKISVFTVVFFAALSSVFSIVGPKILGKITTKLSEGLIAYVFGTGLLTDFKYMGTLAIVLVILYIISALCMYLQSFIMSKVSMSVTYNLRRDISKKMSKIPLNYYDTRTHGEVLSRVTNDVETINQGLNQSITQFITSIATVIGVVVMMLSISWLMTAVALLIIPLTLVLLGGVMKKSQGYFIAQQENLGEMNGHIEEMYGSHNVVKAFNGENDSIEKMNTINEKLYKSGLMSQFLAGSMQPVMNFVGNLGYVAISIMGGYLAVKKVIEIGDIQSFIQYMRNFTMPLAQLAAISNTLQSTLAAAERVFEFLDEEEDTPDKHFAKFTDKFKGDVSFKNVSFGYNPNKIIINNFTADIKSGQTVAIVGPTGAGKTTIVKLLMRFYDINKGKITIDGVDIFDYTRNDLRSMFGMVLQETWLYNASIMDNIRYGTFDATDEEVINAAKAAHCDEFIRSLPGGYNMILNEEASNISQGQKQLFTIARVILANPKILILDEATSSVDTRTEILIQSAMNHLMEGRTSFVIAHRLSTIKDADLILVMRDGDVIEQGNHNELLAQNGFYAGLYNSQFEDGIEE